MPLEIGKESKMRTLKKGIFNNRTEVKFLQGYLNCFEGEKLKIDGAFGPMLLAAVKRYQTKYKLVVDGIVGPNTQRHMGFRKSGNSKIVVLEIPFSKISKADVLLKNGESYSVTKFAAEGYDIVWNGAFFKMATKEICQLVMIDGVVKEWGFGYEGIAYPHLWERAEGGNYRDYAGKHYDMQGGAPVLIKNYIKAEENISKISSSAYNQNTRRNCTGITKSSILLFFSTANCTMGEMLTEGLFQRTLFMQNNDGGGSQSLHMGGLVIPTDGRSIPAAVGLKIRR
jgi:hypothetical protein